VTEGKTFTPEEVEALVTEKLAAAKAEGDTAFQNLWDEAKAAKAKLKAFEGMDPQEIRKKLDAYEKLEVEHKATKAGVTSQELERLRAEVRTDLEKEYAPFKGKVDALGQELRELRLDNVVKGVYAANGVRGDRVAALFKLTRDQYDLTDDGKPMLVERPGTELAKFVQDDLAKEYPEFFEGSGASGGGASKSAAGGGGAVRQIAASDGDAFISNLDTVASGETAVR